MKRKIKDPEKELQKSKTILFMLLLLMFLVVIIVTVQKMLLSKKQQAGQNLIPQNIIISEDMSQEEIQQLQQEVEQLSSRSELSRMKYYLTKYISYIENKEYEKAYEVLYSEFKETYFPTLEEYTSYVQKKYSSFVITDYDDVQRQGNIYILFVNIQDVLDSTNQEKNFSQRFVIQEQKINDFVISFEVVE